MKDTFCRCALALILGSFFTFMPASLGHADEQKPKREKFGPSLKRLKWDKARQVAVEKPAKPDNKKAKENPEADAAVKLKTLLVTFDVLVTDANHTRAIQGLGKDDFIVTEEDKPQQVATFALGNDANLARSIILLIDWSASQRPYIEKSIGAAKVLVSQLGAADEMAIVTDDVDLVCDY